jgi:hypothetical protein
VLAALGLIVVGVGREAVSGFLPTRLLFVRNKREEKPMLKRISAAGAAALAACIAAGAAQAATSYSGTVANGGCDNSRVVPVSGPSRIEGEVASTSSVDSAYVQIVGPNDTVEAAGTFASYDTPGAGAYSVRVCTEYSQVDPPSLQYTATYATGPAGQPALPRTQGAVLGASTTLSHNVQGTGAINTRSGLAFFTVRMTSNGAATIRVYDPRSKQHFAFTNAGVHFLTNGVSFTQGRMTMRLTQGGSSERIVYRSPHFSASGKVVRGSYLIV